MAVLLTGATGFIGRRLDWRLTADGHRVRRAVRQATGLSDAVPIGHLGATTDWQQALVGCHTVVHLAGRAHVIPERAPDPLTAFREVNVRGTLQLAQQAAVAGVRRFVFVSTVGVHGNRTFDAPFREQDVLHPHDAYSMSKHEAEMGLWSLGQRGEMEVVVIRPPLVYGPGAKGNFATLVRWVEAAVPLPLGAVDNRRSFVALDNLVDFIALCANREASPRAANEVFLVSDGEDVSTTEFLRRIARALKLPSRLLPVPTSFLRAAATVFGKGATAGKLLDSLVIDSTKARGILGWRPAVSMNEQLERFIGHDPRA